MFINPAGKENGKCGSPIRIEEGRVFCNKKFNINQDLTTDTTTLIIKRTNLCMVNGSASMEQILDLTA